jgi:hypothetical protein
VVCPGSPALSAVWNTSGIFMEGKMNRRRYYTISAFAAVILSISAYAQRLDGIVTADAKLSVDTEGFGAFAIVLLSK